MRFAVNLLLQKRVCYTIAVSRVAAAGPSRQPTAELLAFDENCARIGGEIAGALLRTGTTVGVADALIAATAITHDLTLVTANVEHYQRMSTVGLRIENWRDTQ